MTDTERGDSRNFSFFRWMHLDVERGPKPGKHKVTTITWG